MQHEPICNNEDRRKDAKLADGRDADEEPHEPEQDEIGYRRDADCRADLAESDAYSHGDGIGKGHAKDGAGLDQQESRPNGALTRVDMFSAPTTTMTNGRIYVGSVVTLVDTPQPFHPNSARMLNDMTVEQHSCTIPVKARPKRECTLLALES